MPAPPILPKTPPIGPKVPALSFALTHFTTYHESLLKPNRTHMKTTSTKDVIDHHLKAFSERDLTGVLSDYAPSVVFFTQNGPLHGPDAIRPLFQTMLAEFAKPGAEFKMKEQFVDGDYGYILWTAKTAENVYELGTDTFIVRDGKIVAQSFTGKITPKT